MYKLGKYAITSGIKFNIIMSDIIGVDKAVFYSLLAKSWGVISFPVTILLIARCFTPEVQGYYYTFNSLLMIQTLLELGFNVVLVQFISHQWGSLSIAEDKQIKGSPIAMSQLASLLILGARWYGSLSVIFLLLASAVGALFLDRPGGIVDFKYPWWALCLAVSLNLLVVPIRSFLDGTNRVYKNQQLHLVSYVLSSVVGWCGIYFGAKLYSAALMSLTIFLVSIIMLCPSIVQYFSILKHRDIAHRISWRNDFWPQQWRIGVSWLSGFFMFQSFVPIVFHVNGPIAAGQMGVTIQIYNSINSIAQSWLSAVSPQFGILWSQRKYQELRKLIKSTYLRSVVAATFFVCSLLLLIVVLQLLRAPLLKRISDLYSLSIFMLVLVLMQLSNVETTAIRFQTKEPFLSVSVVSAILVVTSNCILGYYYGITGVANGFAAVMILFTIPGVHRIFIREINKNHEGLIH